MDLTTSTAGERETATAWSTRSGRIPVGGEQDKVCSGVLAGCELNVDGARTVVVEPDGSAIRAAYEASDGAFDDDVDSPIRCGR